MLRPRSSTSRDKGQGSAPCFFPSAAFILTFAVRHEAFGVNFNDALESAVGAPSRGYSVLKHRKGCLATRTRYGNPRDEEDGCGVVRVGCGGVDVRVSCGVPHRPSGRHTEPRESHRGTQGSGASLWGFKSLTAGVGRGDGHPESPVLTCFSTHT